MAGRRDGRRVTSYCRVGRLDRIRELGVGKPAK
jgi:hypothetical protein